jgi:hypothetical protein
MNARTLLTSSSTEVNEPRRSSFRMRIDRNNSVIPSYSTSSDAA